MKRLLRRVYLRSRFVLDARVLRRTAKPLVASYITTNWGDAFNRELATVLFGQSPVIADLDAVYPSQSLLPPGCPVWFLIGSILHRARPDALVWGSGLMSDHSPPYLARVLTVRGALTRAALEATGAPSGIPLGDPALLVRYSSVAATPTSSTRHHLGVIPHYTDARSPRVKAFIGRTGASMLDIRWPTRALLRAIGNCDLIASSSLHGLIAAHALGIPSIWLHVGDRLHGGSFKFLDFFSTQSKAANQRPSPLPIDDVTSQNIHRSVIRPTPIDLRPMIDAFPYPSSFLATCYRLNERELSDPELSPLTTPA